MRTWYSSLRSSSCAAFCCADPRGSKRSLRPATELPTATGSGPGGDPAWLQTGEPDIAHQLVETPGACEACVYGAPAAAPRRSSARKPGRSLCLVLLRCGELGRGPVAQGLANGKHAL